FVESTRIEIMKANPAYPFHFGNAVQKGGEGRRSIQIHSVVAGVLSDQDHLPHPLRSQLLHLAHNAFDASAAKRSAHDGDTAKSAGVVTPLGNFDMGKMAGSQPLSRESPFIRKNGVAYKHRPSTRNGLGNHLRDPGKIARPHDSVNLRNLPHQFLFIALDQTPGNDQTFHPSRFLQRDLKSTRLNYSHVK